MGRAALGDHDNADEYEEDSVLAFGLKDYWKPEYDVVGCQWDAPELRFEWLARSVLRSERDTNAGTYEEMLAVRRAIAGMDRSHAARTSRCIARNAAASQWMLLRGTVKRAGDRPLRHCP